MEITTFMGKNSDGWILKKTVWEEKMMIKRPTVLQDLTEYKSDNSKPHAKYGLPEDVQFCSICVESNQRPSTTVEYKHNKNSKKAQFNLTVIRYVQHVSIP